MHPQEGIPLIYHDQLNIIASHLADISQEIEEQGIDVVRLPTEIGDGDDATKASKDSQPLHDDGTAATTEPFVGQHQ